MLLKIEQNNRDTVIVKECNWVPFLVTFLNLAPNMLLIPFNTQPHYIKLHVKNFKESRVPLFVSHVPEEDDEMAE